MFWRNAALIAAGLLLPGIALAQTAGQLPAPHYRSLTIETTPTTTVPTNGTLNLGGTSITGFGTGIGQALGPLVNYQGSGFPGLFLSSRLIFQRATPAFNDFSDITIQRTSTFSGGTTANINAALRVQGTFGANDQTVNWLTNVSGTTNQNIGGRFVSNYVQGIRGTAGKVAFWTSLVESRDQNHVASSVSGGQQVAMEMDVIANKADDAINVGTWGGIGNRKGLHLTIAQDDTTDVTPMQVSNGIWFGSNVTTRGYFKSLIGVGGNLQAYSALDTRGLIPVTSGPATVNAVTMTAGQVIDFNGGAALDSAPGDYLWYDVATSKMKFNHGSTTVWSLDASGNLRTLGTVTPSVAP